MALWGSIDAANGYNKPVFANTTNVQSNSTIHGTAANTAKFYGQVFGVSAQEASNSGSDIVTHPGWVSQKIGTGPITGVAIVDGGSGYNSGGFLAVTDTSVFGKGVEANISFTIANTLNTMQNYSTNANWNVVNSIVVNAGGSLYSDSGEITLSFPDTPISAASYTITLGGRGDRKSYETLVAMGSITGDDPRDNVFFKNV